MKRRCHQDHRDPGPGVTSTNHTRAMCRSTNYAPAGHTEGGDRGMWWRRKGGGGGVTDDRKTQRDRNLSRAVLTGMACFPFSINSLMFGG